MISVTSLCDNVNNSKRLWSTEGNSLLVDAFGRRILLDVGRSAEILLHNLDALSVSPDSITDVVLTHSHKGHVGAITEALPFKNAVFYYGDGFELPKYKRKGEEYKAVGNERFLSGVGGTLECVEELIRPLTENIFVFKSKRDYPFLREKKMQLLLDGQYLQDTFDEELNLCIKSSEGLIVISGCSHGGVENILKTAIALSGEKRIYAFVGGTHILDDGERTEKFVSLMRELDVFCVAPTHCTGVFARAAIKQALPSHFASLTTGESLVFKP